MNSGSVAQLAIICAAFMAPPLWVGWAYWKAGGRETLLRRITRRCEIHDRPALAWIRRLETELGMEPSPASGNFVEDHANPRLVDCGHDWCRIRSSR